MKPGTPLVVTISDAPSLSVSDEAPDYLGFLAANGRRFRRIGLPRGSALQRVSRLARLLPTLWSAELVVCDEYLNTAIVAGLLRCSASSARVVALGLNVSGNRMLRTRFAPLDRVLNWLTFRRLDMVVVASRPEARIFSETHDIPLDRMAFVHWAYDLPSLGSDFEPPRRPYFCLIGRNNRDHETFCAAIDGLDADGIIVSPVAAQLRTPPNVRVYEELPFGDCIDCIRRSVASTVLVRDGQRGAGHITIVTAMHAARPQIISAVDTALDYFRPGQHALTVPLHDVATVRAAMTTLLADPQLADRMGAAAADHAALWLTHERRRQILEHRFRRWFEAGDIVWADSAWLKTQDAV